MKSIKNILLSFFYCMCISIINGDIILTEDRAYDPIEIKVPLSIWNQAFRLSPYLKSSYEISVPIYVSQEEDNNNDLDNDEFLEDAVVDTTIASDQIEVVNVTSPSPSTQQDEVTEPPVTGFLNRFPCSCVNGQCGCCTGAIMQRFKQKACTNMTFIPEDFVFDVSITVNNNTVINQRVSASDPPPICFNPRRAPFIRICAEISNIRIRNRNAFACLDVEADIAGFPVYSASFRCFGLGSKGVQTGLKPKKPTSSGPKPVSLFPNTDNDDGGIIEDAADAVFGGGDSGNDGGGGGLLSQAGGLFGGNGEGIFGGGGGSDNDGPLEGIGEAVGEFFGGRKTKNIN